MIQTYIHGVCMYIFCMYTDMYECVCLQYVCVYVCMCHKGVVFWIVCIIVHAQGASHQFISNGEKTNNEASPFTLFGNYDLQKMSVQFAL